MKKKSTPQRIYFIGIGGIGVSALARYFLALGGTISGSDASQSTITQELEKEGVEVKIGHKTSNISPKIDLIIHSAVIPHDNPEIRKARKLSIPIKSYSEAVGELTRKYKTIAIAGSHGKSTTTALLSLILRNTRFDPTVIIGTKLREFASPRRSASSPRKSAHSRNFRKGRSDYLVLEADEYQKSFLHYSPIAAIITNIDREHLDIFKNLSEIKKIFLKFINNIRPGGILVVNKDDKNLFSLRYRIRKIAKKNNLKVIWHSVSISPRKVRVSPRILKIPGNHNLSNALAAYTLAKALGVNQKKIINSISRFRGAWRRMEYRGNLAIKYLVSSIKYKVSGSKHNKYKILNTKYKIPVYDDYAHHPTEIKATLLGLRQKYPKHRIICVFQPHQVQRLKSLFKEFVKSFDHADNLILLDIYKVAGRDKLRKSNFDSLKLTETIKKRKFSPSVIYLKNQKNLPKILKNLLNSKSYILNPVVIVMMGAGDIYNLTKILLL